MAISLADQIAAHPLWVELSTRITTQRLPYGSGDEETAAESIYKIFGTTRDLMEKNPQAAEFQKLAMALLNDTLRPCTARWYGWMIQDDGARDKDGKPLLKFLDEWVRRQFRQELRALQPQLVGYMKALEAMKEGLEPYALWTSPDDATLAALQQECGEPVQAVLGAPLALGIQDQVRFGKMTEADRKVLCQKINDAEANEIRRKRGTADAGPVMNGTALAFSGGGIRSATYCLGITQVLARRKLLSQFDYVSTVSGGGYFGSFLSMYLGTDAPDESPSKTGSGKQQDPNRQPTEDEHILEVKERIDAAFKPGDDQREPRPLRHLRNRSRYLVDGGFKRKCLEFGIVAAGILFNLLIVLPLPLVGALLTVFLYHSHILGDYNWTTNANHWLPRLNTPRTLLLLVLSAVFLLGLLAFPRLKARSLEVLRKHEDAKDMLKPEDYKPLALWMKVMFWLGMLTAFILFCWLIPVGFRVYHYVKTPEILPWLTTLKDHVDQILTVFGLTLATLLGTLATRIKSGGGSGGMLKHLAILSGPLLYNLVYFAVSYRMLFEHGGQHWDWIWVLVATLGITYWAWRTVDVNTYSPHGYYRDRLSECYLQARKISGNGGDPVADDLAHVDRLPLTQLNKCLAAPYHLINTAVNLPSSSLRELRGRDCDFFLFSKHFCGSPMCGYYPTADLEVADPHLDLGTAMAISGAAASSNMGWQTDNSIRLVMTLANVRLGYWLRNPWLGVTKTQGMSGPGPLFLFREMFASHMDEKRHYLNLSDGGHIENLAVYELLRRRTKFILCVDGGMEPDMQCIDLIRLERYASIDLGIKMHYDLDDLLLQPNGFSRAYGILVKIDYNPPDDQTKRENRKPADAEWGWMLYLKLAMVGYGPGYVMDYKRTHPDFPHQSTANQIYDEAQFEAYRALGEAAAETFFVPEIIGNTDPTCVEKWFQALAKNLLPDNDEAIVKTSRQHSA